MRSTHTISRRASLVLIAAVASLASWPAASPAAEATPSQPRAAKKPPRLQPVRRPGPRMRKVGKPSEIRLLSGVRNLVLSPLEFPASAWYVSSETNALWGLTAGTIAGGFGAVERALGGAFEVSTFFLRGEPGGVVRYRLGRSRASKFVIEEFSY